MRDRLRIEKPWRYGGPQMRGLAMYSPGEYRVPLNIPRDLAERAVQEGAATWMAAEDARTAVTVETLPAAAVKKKRGRPARKKRPALTKSLGMAPENKSR